MPRPWTRMIAAAVLGVLGSACDLIGDGGYFGQNVETPLPGKRIAVLSLDRGLTADASAADIPVRLPRPYVNRNWTQFGGNPAHAMYHLSVGEAPRQLWTGDVGKGGAGDRYLLAQPLVVGEVVYTMDALSIVTAFDAERGSVLWRRDLEPEDEDGGYFGGGIAYDGGRIFVSTGFAMVFALDPADGAVIWQQPVPAPVRAAPAAAAGRVFVVTLDNRTVALDAATGSRLWSHGGIEETTSLLGGASPAVAGSTVIAPYSSGDIVGLLAENGRTLWSYSLASASRVDPLGDIAHVRGAPVIDRGMVFALSHSGRMVALDLRRGLRAWERPIGGVEMPWVGGDFIFVLTNEAQLVCLVRRDGRVRWVRALPRYEDPEDQEDPIGWTGPVLASDRLIVAGSHGKAVSVSPYTGEILGATELPGSVSVAPVVAGNSLYLVTGGGRLIAMR